MWLSPYIFEISPRSLFGTTTIEAGTRLPMVCVPLGRRYRATRLGARLGMSANLIWLLPLLAMKNRTAYLTIFGVLLIVSISIVSVTNQDGSFNSPSEPRATKPVIEKQEATSTPQTCSEAMSANIECAERFWDEWGIIRDTKTQEEWNRKWYEFCETEYSHCVVLCGEEQC